MPEALLATTPILGDLLGTLGLGTLAGGGAAAAGAGAADVGATAGLDALGAGAADAGASLLGPTSIGTIADTLAAPSLDALSGGALFGTGADVASTIGSALAFPDLLGGAAAAGGFGAAADSALSSAASSGLASGVGSIPSATAPMDAFLNATPAAGASAAATPAISTLSSTPGTPATGATPSVFDTGTTPVPGLANTGTGYVPAGAGTGATGVSAPASVATIPDPTSAATGATSGAAAAGTPAAAPTSSISQLLSPSHLFSDAVSSLAKNPIGVALGAGGLGYNILEGQKQTANEKALQADAATATANSNEMMQHGEALQQYLTSGTLPPQYMQQVDQAIQSAKTAAISNAAAQGLPTDPTKNTALAATLAGIDNQRSSMITQVASQLFSSGQGLISAGQSAAGLSGQLYQALVSNDTTQAGNIGKAIASLAAALNGKSQASIGGKSITLQAA